MIRCMAVDDEPWALALLTDYINKVPFLELVHATGSAMDALQHVHQSAADLVFLDIQMPEISGLQFMKISNGKCRIILTTAYSEYAMDGYEHNVIDYLLKPISFDRFYTAALKARQILDHSPAEITVMPTRNITDYIFIKTDNRTVRLQLTDILFIEGLKDYIAIHTTSEKIIALENLKTLEGGLPAGRFIRVHRSYIISLDKVDSLERNRIFIKEHIIPIGDTYREPFLAVIRDRHFG